ncbi:MAG: hypothetical protein RJB34_723 [Pseudomonadota bacterium]|jgi:hypothetical protein
MNITQYCAPPKHASLLVHRTSSVTDTIALAVLKVNGQAMLKFACGHWP